MNPGTAQRMKDLRSIASDTIAHGQATSRQLEQVINGVDGPLRDAGRTVEEAVAQLESAIEAYQFHLDKISRLVNTTQGNPGLMQALCAQPWDETLRAAAKEINGQARVWGDLQKTGSTPQKVVKLLSVNWPSYFGTVDGPSYQLDSYYHGGKETGFWYRKPYQKIGSREYPTTPTLAGDLLGAEVMRAMKIPHEDEVKKAAQAKLAGPVDQASSRPSRAKSSKKSGGGSSHAPTQKHPNPPHRVAGKRPSRAKKKAAALQPDVSEDEMLRHALKRTENSDEWSELWEKGATDEQIRAALADLWGGHPGVFGLGMHYQAKGTKRPEFSMGRNLNSVLKGAALINRVRLLLEIPTPEDAPARDAKAQAEVEGAESLDAPQRLLYESLFHTNDSAGAWIPLIKNGATDGQIVATLALVWGRDAHFSGERPDGKYDVNLKKRRVILRIKGEANKQIIRTLEGDAIVHQVRAVLRIPQHKLQGLADAINEQNATAKSKPRPNGHAAPNDPASIEAGAFAGAGA